MIGSETVQGVPGGVLGVKESCISASCIFLGTTLMLTAAASACLTLSLLTDYWEVVSIDYKRVQAIAKHRNFSVGQLGQSPIYRVQSSSPLASSTGVVYLVPLHGGVDSLCVDISEEERNQLRLRGYSLPKCVSYLTVEETYLKNAWVSRMRNLAISCGLVCLILLGACALVGIFGLVKKQISAIMVTGVMFALAALFCTFTLCFMYFKRIKPGGLLTGTVMDKDIPEEYIRARRFRSGWSVALAWGGVGLCILAGMLWILLAKLMRYRLGTIA